jgi:uncharacterized protein
LIFLDTSAIYAIADRGDPNHGVARKRLGAALEAGERLLTHNYVLVESLALIGRRLGPTPAIHFARSARAFKIEWVDERIHDEAVRRLRAVRKREPSFVDHVSFIVMRARSIDMAFAFDPHFETEGFRIFAP